MSAAIDYRTVLGDDRGERDRLIDQARSLEPEARALLDAIGPMSGWRSVDVGCGPVGILDLLSERVGTAGEAVGVDATPRFVEMAAELARERGLANVRVILADARSSGLAPASFDLVHERLVLIGPGREQVVSAMVELARPGGVVAAQEIDITTSFCEPAHPACGRLLEAFVESTRRVGADVAVGRRLGSLLAGAGAADVTVSIQARLEPPGSPRRWQLPGLVRQARAGMLRAGIVEEAELDRLVAESAAHHADPETVVFGGLLFQAWGRKPVG